MENNDLEREELITKITQTCRDIIKKEEICRVNTNDECHSAITAAKENHKADQEILQEDDIKFFYFNNKKYINIELFKTMSEDQIYMSEQEKIPQLFEGIRDIKEKNNGYFLSLQP
jgi:hypothetical protein